MPTYQYACTSEQCQLRFERVQAFTDAAISECPQCNSRVRKVYGSVGVVFKGSGFYRNDSRDAKVGAGKSDSDGPTATKPADSPKGKDADKSRAGSGSGQGGGNSSSGSTNGASPSRTNGKAPSSTKPAAAVGS